MPAMQLSAKSNFYLQMQIPSSNTNMNTHLLSLDLERDRSRLKSRRSRDLERERSRGGDLSLEREREREGSLLSPSGGILRSVACSACIYNKRGGKWIIVIKWIMLQKCKQNIPCWISFATKTSVLKLYLLGLSLKKNLNRSKIWAEDSALKNTVWITKRSLSYHNVLLQVYLMNK